MTELSDPNDLNPQDHFIQLKLSLRKAWEDYRLKEKEIYQSFGVSEQWAKEHEEDFLDLCDGIVMDGYKFSVEEETAFIAPQSVVKFVTSRKLKLHKVSAKKNGS